MSIFGRLGLDLGSLLELMLGSCWRLFRPKLVSEPSSNRLIFEKVIVHETLRFPMVFDPDWTPRWGQDRPKIAPRWVQDRLGSPFFRLEFSLQFLIVLGSILVPFSPPKWNPGGAAELGKSARGRSETVLGSSWFGLFFVLRFGITFLALLGAS